MCLPSSPRADLRAAVGFFPDLTLTACDDKRVYVYDAVTHSEKTQKK